jgi:hypothetical protein
MNTNKIKMLMTLMCAALIVLGMVSGASALTITPSTSPIWTGTTTANLNAAAIAAIVGYSPLVELYKQNVGEATDSGPFASSYVTTFSNTPAVPSDALIDYISGPSISGGPLYLYVKDGNHVPAYYIFGLNYAGAPAWNGTDDLILQNFWTGNGSISHVAIYGPTTAVPEPLTMLLLGLGLVGVAGVRRFRK